MQTRLDNTGCRDVPPEVMGNIETLCNKGLFIQGLAMARPFLPFEGWTTTKGRLLASRLAYHLGNRTLADRLTLLGYRHDPQNPEVLVYLAHEVLETRGPLALWLRMKSWSIPDDTPPKLRARLTGTRARTATLLGDFDAADTLILQAEAEYEQTTFTLLDRASLLEKQDRYEEALQTARKALTLEPLDYHALLYTSHILSLLDRYEEAIQILAEADPHLECAVVSLQLSTLYAEKQRYTEEWRSLDRFEKLSPLIESKGASMLAGRRSACAYYLGDMTTAIAEAKKCESPFFQRIAARLETCDEDKRVLLDVGFVRQHHVTCAPATLTTLGRYWGKEVAHLEIAEAICYDGTPVHSERRWANENGFVTREFTITWDSATALLDRGLPFTVSTYQAANGHAQAVIGYDSRRGTLYLRDPYIHVILEVVADLFLEQHRSSGPRGMVLVPKEHAERLEGIDLPDSALYDLVYDANIALSHHKREEAVVAIQACEKLAPKHLLTLRAQRVLAGYDADLPAILANGETILGMFPGDSVAEYNAIECMRVMASREQRLERLEEICGRKVVNPIFWEVLAAELSEDARSWDRAARLIRRVLRTIPERAGAYGIFASLLWKREQFDEAIAIFRFAACLSPMSEPAARTYFNAAWMKDRADEAIRFLEHRNERLGGLSMKPVTSLFGALEALERTKEAFDVLESSQKRRPDDGDLTLFAAFVHGSFGHVETAEQLLVKAESKTSKASWLRVAARLADVTKGPADALKLWQDVLKLEPFAEDANEAVALRFAMTVGPNAALDHLEEVCKAFPHHHALLRLRILWLGDQKPSVRESAIRRFLAIEPRNEWGHEQLAIALMAQQRFQQAEDECRIVGDINPSSVIHLLITAQLADRKGSSKQAKKALREAIRRCADLPTAIVHLMAMAATKKDVMKELDFVQEEVFKNSKNGDGILAWFEVARGNQTAEWLLSTIQTLQQSREGLPMVWTILIHHLVAMDKLDEALAVAKEASSRFALQAKFWMDLAYVLEQKGDFAGQADALKHALAHNPMNADAAIQLACAHLSMGSREQAHLVIERALARTPLDVKLLGFFGDILWAEGDHDASIEHLRRALMLGPSNLRAWEVLHNRYTIKGNPEEALKFAREFEENRRWDAGIRLCVAHLESVTGRLEQALRTLDRVISIKPNLVEAHDMRAQTFAELRQFAQAQAACNPAVFSHRLPNQLRCRSAVLYGMSGDVPAALSGINDVLVDRPDFLLGWVTLAQFHQAMREPSNLLDAADKIVQLEPLSPIGYKFRATANLWLGDRKKAKKALQDALHRDPADVQLGLELIDLEIEFDEFDEANATIQRIEAHVHVGAVAAKQVRIACRQKRDAEATQIFRRLCHEPAVGADSLCATAEALGFDRANRILDELLDNPKAVAHAGRVWIETLLQTNQKPSIARLRHFLEEPTEARTEAVITWLNMLGARGSRFETLWYIGRLFKYLRGDTHLWAATGAALAGAHLGFLSACWLRDYRIRSGMEPWMLWNLSVALRARLRSVRALEVNRYALALAADSSMSSHRVWIAYHEALRGEREVATELLNEVAPLQLRPKERQIWCLTQSMLEVQNAPPDARRDVLEQVQAKVMWDFPNPPKLVGVSLVAQAYFKAMQRMARDARIVGALIRAYRGWVLALVALVVLVLLLGDIKRLMVAETFGALSVWVMFVWSRWVLARL